MLKWLGTGIMIQFIDDIKEELFTRLDIEGNVMVIYKPRYVDGK